MYKNSLAFITLGTALSLLCIYIIIDYYSGPIEDTEEYLQADNIHYNYDEPLLPVWDKKNTINEETSQVLEVETFKPIFEIKEIDDDLFEKMMNTSFYNRGHITRQDLKLLLVGHYNFDNEVQQGEIIVHEKVAEEILEIFQELYDHKYPIDKITLVHHYDGSDDLSMADNNTHSFNDRLMTGGKSLSHHAYGLAIDINPVQNPYVYNQTILPPLGKEFLDRDKHIKGMILKDDPCYQAFISRGWQWGGDWSRPIDYQHFEKILPSIND